MSQHNKEIKCSLGLRRFALLLLSGFLGLSFMGCDDKKRPVDESVFSFENRAKTDSAEMYTQNLVKLSVDTLSQSRRLFNFALDPNSEIDKIKKSCATIEIDSQKQDLLIIKILWRDINCRLGTDKQKYKLSGQEIFKIYYSNNDPTKIELTSKNLQLHTQNKVTEIEVNASLKFNNLNKFDFKQNLFFDENDKEKQIFTEWEILHEGTGPFNFGFNSMLLNNVKIESSFEKFKLNSSQKREYLSQHKLVSYNTDENHLGKPQTFDVYFNTCGSLSGNFKYEINYNNKTQFKGLLTANNLQFIFTKKAKPQDRLTCDVKEPFVYKALSTYSTRFKGKPSAVIGKTKKPSDSSDKKTP